MAGATREPAVSPSRWLILLGLVLFLLGLLTGFAQSLFANARMGVSAHLEGLMNGMFLIVLGLIWPQLALGIRASLAAFALVIYSAFANWFTVTLSAFWGAGASMMPLAGQGMMGSTAQEASIRILLITVGISMVAGVVLIIHGLVRQRAGTSSHGHAS